MACSQPAPNPNGYVGTIYGFIDGKLALVRIAGVASTWDNCEKGVKPVIQGVLADAPDGASVAATCYPVPEAPPAVHKAVPADDQKTTSLESK